MAGWLGWRAVACTVVVVAVLSACSSAPQTSSDLVATSPPPLASSPPPVMPSPAPNVPSPCADSIQAGVTRTLMQQLAAFSAGDYAAAYALASRSFRSEIDLTGFTRLIRTGYPEVAESTASAMVVCQQPGPGVVVATVSVTGANGRTVEMVYRFILEGDAWRVDGASAPQETSIAA